MTKETREKILSLREGGMGYQTIAREVGESRDAVRYICKSRVHPVEVQRKVNEMLK
ncbi:MAG: hypothetical protein K6F35_02320 [Lachnospiraceae bacterium]|nr:hypothetical protein [Lachnospiraceae bacterium]